MNSPRAQRRRRQPALQIRAGSSEITGKYRPQPCSNTCCHQFCFSCRVGINRTLEQIMPTAFEMTNSNPAAVESAAAKPPAELIRQSSRKFRNLRVRQHHDVWIKSIHSGLLILDRGIEPHHPRFCPPNLMRPVASIL